MHTLTSQSRAQYKKWNKTLKKIEREYKISSQIVLSIWGRETAFGKAKIPFYAIEVLATQAFLGNRKEYFKKQLMLALQILHEGHVTIKKMKSSWAGAMGYTQFMPEDFVKYAVDFDKDGKRDIWQSVPDALASTANYLKKNGWQKEMHWGYEIQVPSKFDCRLEGFDKGRSIYEWKQLGVKVLSQKKSDKWLDKQKLYLLMPAGVKGPSFLVSDNFLVIKTYNQANLYALFIGHLADRMSKEVAFKAKWPGLKTYSRDNVRNIQRQLAKLGYEVGKIDGIIGPKSRSIIGSFQSRNNIEKSCYLNKKFISTLAKKAKKQPTSVTSDSNK